MNPQTEPETDWHPKTPLEDEHAIIWLYDSFLFPLVRQGWEYSRGKKRPMSRTNWNDDRLIIGYSTLRDDADDGDGLYLRRVFFLLPKDIAAIKNYWEAGDGAPFTPPPWVPRILPMAPEFVTPINTFPTRQNARFAGQDYENHFNETWRWLMLILDAHTRT